MQYINDAPVGVQYFFIFLFALWGIKLWLNWRKAKNEFPKFDYDAGALSPEHKWSWANPPEELKLSVDDSEKESVVKLSSPATSTEIFCSLFAALLAFLGVYLIGVIIYRAAMQEEISVIGSLIMVALIFAASWGLTKVETPVLSITRTPHSVKISVRQAYYWQRSVYINAPAKPGMKFEGKLQGFLEMTTDQLDSLPDYYLLVKRPWHSDQKFILRVTPSQGSWIVSGLNQWLDASIARHEAQANQASA